MISFMFLGQIVRWKNFSKVKLLKSTFEELHPLRVGFKGQKFLTDTKVRKNLLLIQNHSSIYPSNKMCAHNIVK